jgi:glucose/arabinose dehydrogenase
MKSMHVRASVVMAVLSVIGWAQPAAAQLKATVYTTGLTQPLDIVQDPLHTNVQFVVQQGGRIRVVQDRVVQAQDFLDMTGVISTGGERGLLGLAFAPDYATSRRFYIYFTDTNGNLVISRFLRSTNDSLRADTTTRLDFEWAANQRAIPHPTFGNHNGGHLAFGPDGYLYAGTGDGGGANDPPDNAQNLLSLLGKILRLNINGPHQNDVGYDIPPDNPFVGRQDARNEIWAVGVRNPWRFSFDPISSGGTDALVIGDVGQGSYEEIDYEPANTGGRNYGWRNREGLHDNITSLPPAYLPLTDPIFEYDHTVGQSITGGFVFRGSNLPARFNGRYFFADYVAGRVWSLGLQIGQGGNATAGTLEEHTGELGGSSAIGNISSFGVGPSGELFIVGYSKGNILRIDSSVASNTRMNVDTPASGSIAQPFAVTGWAVDLGAPSGNGVDIVHVWAVPQNGPPVFLGASEGLSRPDVGGAFGSQFAHSGFSVVVDSLPAGPCQVIAYAHSTVTGQFSQAQSRSLVIAAPNALLAVESPHTGDSFPGKVTLSGWAIDASASSGTGIDLIHIWATPPGQSTKFIGTASYGTNRPDVGSTFGPQFANSGWSLTAADLTPGTWTFYIYAHSTVTNSFRVAQSVTVDTTDGLRLSVERPISNETIVLPAHGQASGWTLDLGAATGTGVSAVHVWAVPTGGGSPVFLGTATMGLNRPENATSFGSQFGPSGFTLDYTLPTGSYVVVVYALRTRTQKFDIAQVVSVIVQ